MTIDEIITDLQDVANYRHLEYDAKILYKTYIYQYQNFSKKSCTQQEYCIQKINELLEIMVTHYEKDGSGRKLLPKGRYSD